ncbi:MAG: hypothetical protein U5O16_03175 [Rhodococcus sp. (in: high G+C Gram-positive bacteria)]|nr:hypothetical protein [Rhodococcus sp. (in: high G+C Gram-positive bacteria)]
MTAAFISQSPHLSPEYRRARRQGRGDAQGAALNEHSAASRKIYSHDPNLNHRVDGEFVYRQRSDGLIVSSPTGSTAYALSCGGPIMHPKLDAIVLVPMNPHMLSSRPIVVSVSSEICIYISHSIPLHPHITRDGQSHVVTHPGDCIEIFKSNLSIELIHPRDHNFYDICRSKLGWTNQAGNP